jgi:cobalt/nickel transport system ATP-binding protein
VIEVRGLGFSYPSGRRVFDGLDFTLREGERIGLTGPNGSGKSTLFHLIMGLIRPDEGEIRVFGKARSREEDFLEIRKLIGLLFQDSDDQLFCPTVEEDIAFGPLNLGKSHEEAREIVEETVRALGLEGIRKRITHRLSEGEKRLAALATVAAMEPRCLLLDEPTAGLDQETTGRLLDYLRDHAKTYVVSSHDREFLEASVDAVYLLEDSRVTLLRPRSPLQ